MAVPVQEPGVNEADTENEVVVPALLFAIKSARVHLVFGAGLVAKAPVTVALEVFSVIVGAVAARVTLCVVPMSPLIFTLIEPEYVPVPPLEFVNVTDYGTVIT